MLFSVPVTSDVLLLRHEVVECPSVGRNACSKGGDRTKKNDPGVQLEVHEITNGSEQYDPDHKGGAGDRGCSGKRSPACVYGVEPSSFLVSYHSSGLT